MDGESRRGKEDSNPERRRAPFVRYTRRHTRRLRVALVPEEMCDRTGPMMHSVLSIGAGDIITMLVHSPVHSSSRRGLDLAMSSSAAFARWRRAGETFDRFRAFARADAPPPARSLHRWAPSSRARRFAAGSDASGAPAPRMTLRSAFQYCQSRVRQHDYENYLCTLALPAAHRPAALALRAFNVETASALGAVKEPHLALVRLRWWRDAVAAVHRDDDDVPDHPVAVALAAVLRGGRGGARTRRWMNAIVDARVRDAESNSPPLGVPYLEAYADATASSLLYLILDLCEVRHADADHAAAHLGKAIGIANLLRGTKAHAAQRRSYIPLDVAAKHGAATEDVYRATPTEGVRNAVHEVASVAKAHLDSARAMAPRLRADRLPSRASAIARAALLPAVGAGAYLDALEARDFDPFHPELVRGNPPLVTQARIAWAACRGRY